MCLRAPAQKTLVDRKQSILEHYVPVGSLESDHCSACSSLVESQASWKVIPISDWSREVLVLYLERPAKQLGFAFSERGASDTAT
jgi:hypothetical protein